MKLTPFLLFFMVFFNWPLIDGISIHRCPFPGIPAHATARKGHREIPWATQNDFYEGETVEFFCKDEWAFTYNQQAKIRCLSKGNWSGPLPRCGECYDFNRSVGSSVSFMFPRRQNFNVGRLENLHKFLHEPEMKSS